MIELENVFSAFDGMSCGQIALNRQGIKYKNYYASEIDKHAIKVTQANYPDTIQTGDITELDITSLPKIDLLIGGSPCQSFSFAGKQQGMTTTNNEDILTLERYLELKESGFTFIGQSYLFWEYINILSELKPKYFLLENVKMAQKWRDVISKTLGVQPVMIDSGLVSAQTRQRYYWTNIPNIIQPTNKNIYIDDILEVGVEYTFLPKTRLDYKNYDKKKVDKSIHKSTPTQIGSSRRFGNAVRSNGKAFTLRRINPNGIIDEDYNIRHFTPIEVERLQTVPDKYTLIEGIKTKERYGLLGNGWTVDVIAHIFSFME